MKFKVAAVAFLVCASFPVFAQKRLSDGEISSMKIMIQHFTEAKSYCKVDDSFFEASSFAYNPFTQKFELNIRSDSKFMSALKNVVQKELQKSNIEDLLIGLFYGDAQLSASLKKEFEERGGKFQTEYKLDIKSQSAAKYYSDIRLRKVMLDSFYTQKKCNKETLESDRLQFKKDFESLNECKAVFIENSPFFRSDLVCDGVVHQDLIADADKSIWKKAL